MRRFVPLAFLFVALGAAVAGEPVADRPAKGVVAPEREDLVDFGITGMRFFDAGFDRRAASLAMTRVGFDGTFKLPSRGQFSFELGIAGNYSNYEVRNFSALLPPIGTVNFPGNGPYTTFGRPQVDASAFANRSPIRDVGLLRLEPLLGYDFNRTWGLVTGPVFEFGGASHTSLGDTARLGGVLAAKYTFKDKTELTLGGEVISRLERKPTVYPFIRVQPGSAPGGLFSFIPNSIELEAEPDGATLVWNVTKPFSLFVSGSVDEREYRLSRRSSIPYGIWRESGILLSAGIRWNVTRKISVNAFGGAMVNRQIEVDDRHGNRAAGQRDVDPSPFVGGELRVSF